MSSTESTQTTIRIEAVPQTWDTGTDSAFFTIVARLFAPGFTYGAGVLLATYDDSDADQVGRQSTPRPRAGLSLSLAQPTSEPVPVAVPGDL